MCVCVFAFTNAYVTCVGVLRSCTSFVSSWSCWCNLVFCLEVQSQELAERVKTLPCEVRTVQPPKVTVSTTGGKKPGHTWENYGVHSKVFVRSWFSLAMFISTSYTYRIESYIYPAIRDQRADRIDASWYLSSQGMWAKHDENSTYVWFFDFFDMANGIGHHEVEQAVALNAWIQFPYGACLKSEAYFWSDPSLRSRSDLASANSAYFSSHSLWKIAMMPWLSIIHSV